MQIEDFKLALDDRGIDYRESGASLVLKHCPACGSDKYKVHLRAELDEKTGLFFGRCYAGSCQTNYSSIKYLLMIDIPYHEVMRIHGRDNEAAFKALTPEVPDIEVKKQQTIPQPIETVNISSFFKLKEWPEHTAAKYAIKRGALPEWDNVMIDHEFCAVVFVVFENGKPVGYQRRFVHPTDPNFKTKTSSGFKAHENLLIFHNPGKDILICEGPFTAISAYHFGYTGVCTFGAGISETQLNKIYNLSKDLGVNIGVAFDKDEAGDKGAQKIQSFMYSEGQKVFKIQASTGNDLNDTWMAGGKALLIEEKFEYNPAVPSLKRFH